MSLMDDVATRRAVAFLGKYPEILHDICTLVNRQQADHRGMARLITGGELQVRAYTPERVVQAIREQGPAAVLGFFEELHQQHEAILKAAAAAIPGVRERVDAFVAEHRRDDDQDDEDEDEAREPVPGVGVEHVSTETSGEDPVSTPDPGSVDAGEEE